MADLAERKLNVRRYTWQDNRKPLSERLEERLKKLEKKPAFRMCQRCGCQKPNTKVYFNDFPKCKDCQRVEYEIKKRKGGRVGP